MSNFPRGTLPVNKDGRAVVVGGGVVGAACLREPEATPVVEEWFGWRPMTYDSLPIIDRSPHIENVWIAAGHNMLGVSMSPGTGKLLAKLIARRTPFLDPQPYSLRRFSRGRIGIPG